MRSVSQIVKKAKKIKLLLLDVDGVLTDGRIIYLSGGQEMKNYNVHDGLGISLLTRAGLKTAIITAKGSPVVHKRAQILKIERVYEDYLIKIEALSDIKNNFRVKEEEICYMGDDIIDVPLLKRVGLAVSVPNGVKEARACAHYVTKEKGGKGAVREVCELILKAQGKWREVTKVFLR